ncbi:MAG: D-amino-acid oxidase [Amycolatopsis sp.]|jgi:D-amino-acid oxidase|uniref:NAD(P)/FAD-dependent oxidoreductase n=1 Tax=Amycolatopsis sp. TaxID=37632 RepID=UPI0026164D27|nr:FAD-dependent oxidoreductase [Amycolatopsis sp.]MCU1682422.1 D-amino-acid oxidase [Amycolatopsis sp.]
MRVAVVGGGVIGLSCASRLVHAGHAVTVISEGKPSETTSAIAGGLIYPPGTRPFDRCAAWTSTSVAEFRGMGGPGIRMMPGRLIHAERVPDPEWTVAMDDVAWEGATLTFTTAVVDTPVYLDRLAAGVASAGVRFEYRRVHDLDDVDADLVVNAAGLGGGDLAGDDSVRAVGGQVVHLADPGLTEWACNQGLDPVAYVIPHGTHVVCGGTEEPGRPDVDPDPDVAAAIVRRCRELVPALADAPILGTKVGLRPYRPEVRLERVGDVIHCYGHGGAGITLSWGCADDVLALVG